MLLTENKLNARIQEISRFRYRDARPIHGFACLEDDLKQVNGLPPDQAEWGRIEAGERWSGRDLYLWLKTKLSVPAEWSGRSVLGRFDFGNTGGGNNSGFESLLYINSRIYQGVDSNHKEVLLPAGTTGDAELLFRLWSGLEGGGVHADQEHKIALAELCWLDEKADDFYYLSLAALETIRELSEQQPERTLLLTALDRTYRRIDWSSPGSDAFYETVYDAREFFLRELAALEKHHPVTVQCIGHTHIDVAWLWRLKHTREKAARSFSTVLRLMERYPEYIFLQTQPQLYDYIKTDFPELYGQIRKRMQEGRWEAAGGMWLEADCNLTSGESLVRQLLQGTRFLRKEFGTECTYLWLPDVFGYSWSLPQILKKSGISTFMTTKISWNQYNRMPHDTFWWRGIDGTEVLTHFITTPEPWSAPGSWFYTYNGQISAKTVKGIWDAYRDKNNNQELLLSYGYGDGGGGVNRDMLEMRRHLDLMPGIPKLTTGKAGDYFAGLHERMDKASEYVHTWDGELYLEYHRGTYTSQAYNKRMNRKLELLYRETEWLGSLAGAARADWSEYPQMQLEQGWKIILRNQFHDIIPGSSIHEVYEDSREEYAQAEQLALESQAGIKEQVIARETEESLKGNQASFTLLNPANWTRSDMAEIPLAPANMSGSWLDKAGNRLTAQRTEKAWLVASPPLAPMALNEIRFAPGPGAAGEAAGQHGPNGLADGSKGSDGLAGGSIPEVFQAGATHILTPYYEIAWDGDSGQLTRIYDREANREVLAPGKHGNVLQLFEDKPLAHEAWDIDIFYQEKSREIRELEYARLVEQGPLCAVIEFAWSYGQSQIRQRLTVYAHSRRIDFCTEADWHEHKQLLKTAFPVDIRATEATYDIQFGNVKRPTHWNTSWDYARFETVGHQWADLSEHGYGVSLLNDCKYGYDIKGSTIRLSLIKCATHPDPEADQGRHEFTYSLLPHRGDWREGDTVKEAWALNNPLQVWAGATSLAGLSLIRTSSPHVLIDAVKKAEDEHRLVVRLHEFAGGRGACTLTSDFEITSWQECDLLERPTGELRQTSTVELDVVPYEIKTVLIEIGRRH